jgi:transposase InsO family protein
VRLRRVAKREKPRKRFVPRRPHIQWHMDAKGPEKIRLASGEEFSFRVLTILDGASRAVLASLIVPEEDTRAAVRVFRLAVRRYGLPSRIYMDRGSPYDSRRFRNGLAVAGVNRIFVKPRNPRPNGKIEAFHRTLQLWFFRPLRKQVVIDAVHLQQLLDGVIHFYQQHHHRDLEKSPEAALGGVVSSRAVSAERLRDAFLESRHLKTHRTTGEVRIPRGHGMYLVPREDLRGRRLEFLIDPDLEVVPFVIDPESGRRLPLVRAAVRPEDAEEEAPRERWGHGVLQRLFDNWQGKVRPVAEPGFGLPEVFDLLAGVAGRPVPATDAEAARIQKAYAALGPLPSAATEAAFCAICAELGPGRPLQVYLEALGKRVLPASPAKSSRSPKSSRPTKRRRSRP